MPGDVRPAKSAKLQATRKVRSTPRMLSSPRSSAVRNGSIAALLGRNLRRNSGPLTSALVRNPCGRRRCSPRCPDASVRRLTNTEHRENTTVASTWSVCKGLAAVVITSAAAFALCPNAAADPATPQPNPTQQLPGLPALAQLSPIIQQAAMNPAQATQLLMAAASAFAGNPAVPTESKNVASSVNQFVAEPTNPDSAALGVPAPHGVALPEAIPVPHVPPLGAEPGVQAHLPTGIDPSHAAGPAPAVAPTVDRKSVV